MVEQSAVNRLAVGSNPTWGVDNIIRNLLRLGVDLKCKIKSTPKRNNVYGWRDSNSHNIVTRT